MTFDLHFINAHVYSAQNVYVMTEILVYGQGLIEEL